MHNISNNDRTVTAYRFDDLELDLNQRQLFKNGTALPLNAKYFDLLRLLIENRGRLMSKEDLFGTIWKDVIVSDSALSQAIKDIRKTLSDDARSPRYIRTLPKRGYMFIQDAQPVFSPYPGQTHGETVAISRPYKFLDFFDQQDAGIFFGRDQEIACITSKIKASQTFIIHGKSGVGKSSIIRAGVIPRLIRDGFTVSILRTFPDPQQSLETELDRAADADSAQQTGRIFIFDHFEEFFTILPEKQRKQFITAIRKRQEANQLSPRFIFVLREDKFSAMSIFKSVFPDLFYHEFRLNRLSQQQATEAISRPAELAGVHIDANLIQRILDDLQVESEIDPPQLQIVCDSLYDRRDDNNHISLDTYADLGGASVLLNDYLQRVLQRYSGPDVEIARTILKSLVSLKRERLILPVEKVLIQATKQADAQHLNMIIEELAAARIIRISHTDGTNWLELAHDFLLESVADWLDQIDIDLKKARTLLDQAVTGFREHNILVGKDALKVLVKFCPSIRLTPDEANLLLRSMLMTNFPVPACVLQACTQIDAIIPEALQHEDIGIRLNAVNSLSNEHALHQREHLLRLALFDENTRVRKAASIKLLKQGDSTTTDLLIKKEHSGAGVFRRAISLAYARNYKKDIIHLRSLPPIMATLITLSLFWVRIQRNRAKIVKEVTSATTATMFSGAIIGLILGIGLSLTKNIGSVESLSTLLALISLGGLTGLLGGFAVSLGISVMDYVSFRHSRWWTVPGGAVSGALMGGLVHMIGVDILKVLFGHELNQVTGPLEGFIMGGGIAFGYVFSRMVFRDRFAPVKRLFFGALGGMLAAFILTNLQGNLFSGSIEIIAHSFSDSHVNVEDLARLFGEKYFGRLSRLVIGAAEGFIFGGFLVAGIELARKKLWS